MRNTNHLDEKQLTLAQAKILRDIKQQCEDGAQNQGLPRDARACGQFYGGEASNRQQRGLHGTAAALGVLCEDGGDQGLGTAKKLAQYIRDRRQIEVSSAKAGQTRDQRFDDDEDNIVKQCEIYMSLARCSVLSQEEHLLIEDIKTKITKSGLNIMVP